MKNININSFGVIPFFVGTHGLEVLVTEQYSAQGTHWGFPKGESMPGETPVAAAMRAVTGETGVKLVQVLTDEPYMLTYTFSYEDAIVSKTVYYYIGFVETQGLALQTSDIKNANWYAPEAARMRLSFESTQLLFDQVLERVQREQARHGK